MITTTLDPISLDDFTDTESLPFLFEGKGDSDLKIYFESGHNRQEYLDTPLHASDGGSTTLNGVNAAIADNPITGSINQANQRLHTQEKTHEQL